MRLALILMLMAGCGYYEQPRQAEAVTLVWSLYPKSGDPPPIEWRDDGCGELPAISAYGACLAGVYYPGDHAVVAWRGSYAASAFAHELMHANQWQRGTDDFAHSSPDWRLVPLANEKLASLIP